MNPTALNCLIVREDFLVTKRLTYFLDTSSFTKETVMVRIIAMIANHAMVSCHEYIRHKCEMLKRYFDHFMTMPFFLPIYLN